MFIDNVKKERYIRTIAVLIIIFICGAVIFIVENLLISFILAFVINYLLSPFVDNLERRGFTRLYGSIIVFSVLTFFVGIYLYYFIPNSGKHLDAFISEIPKYGKGTIALAKELEAFANNLLNGAYTVNFSESLDSNFLEISTEFMDNLPSHISAAITILLLSPFFAFFMIAEGRFIMQKLMILVPNNLFEMALTLQYQINNQVGGFIRARLLEAGIVGFIVWIGLLIIGFPYALLLAVIAALTNLIPYIGPFIAIIPAVLIALVNGSTSMEILMVISVYFISQMVDVVFIVPFVVAKIVDLHAGIVVVAIIAGAQFGGIIGMIISIPVVSILKLTSKEIYDYYLHH
ncbi:MAG: AI-2E family transporter [Desulfobacterales bacterium]|nr:AI-2E family transporter [Desulfobacterales bacterium]MCP4163833.1 AI-2E family transporter [Deltaproteobacteria bacterium]